MQRRTESIFGETQTYDYGYNLDGRPWLETVERDRDGDGGLVSHYSLDANGNRTAVSLDRSWAGGTSLALSGTDISTALEDRLTQYGTASFEYDSLGRVKRKTEGTSITTYGWDSVGALQTVSLPSGTSIEYVTDGVGRRIGKKVNGTLQKKWIYRDQLRVVGELDASGNLVSRFVYGPRYTPEYMEKGGVKYRLITDQLGSVRLVVNSVTGAVAQRIDYDEFGVVLSDSNPGFQPFGFAGGIYDNDTGLVRFGAREYDARIGRWLAKDRIRSRNRVVTGSAGAA